MSIKKLQSQLDKIIKDGIPKPIHSEKTFLDMAGITRKENKISNLLAFYFNPEEEHGFKYLFINAFIDCVKASKKYNNFKFDYLEFNINREYSITSKKNADNKERIDILIQSVSEPKSSIIIENKIDASLDNNDLENYWEKIKTKNKVGVVLSIKKVNLSDYPMFINILYKDFVKSINKKVELNCSKKHHILLKDFLDNINKMTENKNTPEEIDFFLKNFNAIQKIEKKRNHILKNIASEINDVGNALNFLTVTFGRDCWQWTRENLIDYKFEIWFDYSKKYYLISFLVLDSNLNFKTKILTDEIIEQLKLEKNIENRDISRKGFTHLFGKKYPIEIGKLFNLNNTLNDNYQESWKALEQRVKEIIFPTNTKI